jgi:hypothetical protein
MGDLTDCRAGATCRKAAAKAARDAKKATKPSGGGEAEGAEADEA